MVTRRSKRTVHREGRNLYYGSILLATLHEDVSLTLADPTELERLDKLQDELTERRLRQWKNELHAVQRFARPENRKLKPNTTKSRSADSLNVPVWIPFHVSLVCNRCQFRFAKSMLSRVGFGASPTKLGQFGGCKILPAIAHVVTVNLTS